MQRRAWAVVAVLAMSATGCGSSSGDSKALRDDLEAAQADTKAAEAERDELAAKVEDLQSQLDELTGGTTADTAGESADTEPPATEPENTETATTAPPTTEPATTTPAPTGVPAAPDASKYAASFGDISVVSLPAGDPGVVAVIASGAALDRSHSIPIIIRNNTSDTIGQIEVTGIARDAAGTLAGSGSSQGFQPKRVEPGEIAWGYVFFGDTTGDGLTFELSASGDEASTYFQPIEITELNANDNQIVGVITNTSDDELSGPISVGGICFAADGSLLGTFNAFSEQDKLAAGGTGSFSADLYGDACPNGLLGASGYGKL